MGVQLARPEDFLVLLVFSNDLSVILIGMGMGYDFQIAIFAYQSIFIQEPWVFTKGKILLLLETRVQPRDYKGDVVITVQVYEVIVWSIRGFVVFII